MIDKDDKNDYEDGKQSDFLVCRFHGSSNKFILKGKITNKENNTAITGEIKIFESDSLVKTIKTTESGTYSVQLQLTKTYNFLMSKSGYLPERTTINF